MGRWTAVAASCCLVLRAHAGVPAAGFADAAFVTGLVHPTAIAFLPDGRLLIAEKEGPLKLSSGGTATTLVTIPVCSNDNLGLHGVTIDPAFSQNGFIYLQRSIAPPGGCFTDAGRTNEIFRLTMAPGDTIDLASFSLLVGGIRTDTGDHHGGDLHFGPDGKLYAALGDTGLGDNQGCPGTSTNPFAQDLDALEGKVLRLNADGSAPPDNPFFGQAGAARDKIFALGFRNPFRWAFDPLSGNLWLADVGDIGYEEIDIVVAGGNYGWPRCEGIHPIGCELPGDVPPIFAYAHGSVCPDQGPPLLGESITGGTFAADGFGTYATEYVFGDWIASALYRAVPTAARSGISGTPVAIVTGARGPTYIAFGPDAALYYASYLDGQIRRVTTTQAASDERLPGRRLRLLARAGDPERRKLSAVLASPGGLGGGNGSTDDPTIYGGAVRLRSAAFDLVHRLPPGSAWSHIGPAGTNRGYRYRDKDRVFGPIKSVVIRGGRVVKVKGSGPLLDFLLATDPGPVDVVVRTGRQHYCASFGGTVSFAPGTLIARDALAPAICPS